MQQIKRAWNNQDLANKVILVTGVAMAVICLVMGKGLYSVIFIGLMFAFMMAHSGQRAKRLQRLYGGMYFHMPDGEVVPVSFEQVRTEYVKGQQGKYADRSVSLWFPYWRINEDGMLDTGFGLEIDLTGYEDKEGLLPLLKKGDFIYVTGRVQAKRRNYFCIDRVEDIRRQETRP